MSSPIPSIRHAAPPDLDVLADLVPRTFWDTYRDDVNQAELKAYIAATFSRAQIAAELADRALRYLLAYVEEQPVGYAMLRIGPAPEGVQGSGPVELARIYLDRDYIGHGLGAGLLQACLDEAAGSGYGTIWLGVWECNARAIRFYEKWGFRRVGAVSFELGSELQTDILMARSLGNGV